MRKKQTNKETKPKQNEKQTTNSRVNFSRKIVTPECSSPPPSPHPLPPSFFVCLFVCCCCCCFFFLVFFLLFFFFSCFCFYSCFRLVWPGLVWFVEGDKFPCWTLTPGVTFGQESFPRVTPDAALHLFLVHLFLYQTAQTNSSYDLRVKPDVQTTFLIPRPIVCHPG